MADDLKAGDEDAVTGRRGEPVDTPPRPSPARRSSRSTPAPTELIVAETPGELVPYQPKASTVSVGVQRRFSAAYAVVLGDLRDRRARHRAGDLTGFRPGAPPKWSSFQPSGERLEKAQEIADYVAPGYKLDDQQQMVVVQARDAGVGSQQIQFVAVPGQSSSTTSSTAPNTVAYEMCGLGEHCSISSGTAVDRPRPAAAARGARDRALHVQVRRQHRRRRGVHAAAGRRHDLVGAAVQEGELRQRARALDHEDADRSRLRPGDAGQLARARPGRAADGQRALLVQGAGRERRAGAGARRSRPRDGPSHAQRSSGPVAASTPSTTTRHPIRMRHVRLFVAPWFFELPPFRRFDGYAAHWTILLRKPPGPGGASDDLVTHELCHVWQMQHRPFQMPLVLRLGAVLPQPLRGRGAPGRRRDPRVIRDAAARPGAARRRRGRGDPGRHRATAGLVAGVSDAGRRRDGRLAARRRPAVGDAAGGRAVERARDRRHRLPRRAERRHRRDRLRHRPGGARPRAGDRGAGGAGRRSSRRSRRCASCAPRPTPTTCRRSACWSAAGSSRSPATSWL